VVQGAHAERWLPALGAAGQPFLRSRHHQHPSRPESGRRMGRYLRVRGGPRHGRIDVVGTFSGPGESRDIFYRSRPAGDMVWAAWDRLEDNGFDGDIVAAVAGHDGLDVVTPVDLLNDQGFPEVDMSGRRCLPDGTWTSWTLLGRPQGGFTVDITPVLILGPGGLELFAVSATNVILIRCRRFPRRALALGGPLGRARRPTRPPADQPGSPSHRTGAAHSRLPRSPLSCSRPPQQTIPAARPYTR